MIDISYMDNKRRQEFFSLIEFCKVYNHDVKDFVFDESPDFKSEKLSIGVECTSSVFSGEYEATAKAIKFGEIKAFGYWVSNATDPCRLVDIVKNKTKKLNSHYKHFNTNALFIRVSSIYPGANHFSIREAEDFSNILKNASLHGKHQFNPIILSEMGNAADSFGSFIIDTERYTVGVYQGKRSLL